MLSDLGAAPSDRRHRPPEQGRSAALLLRVWTEGGSAGFRARLTAVGTNATPPAAGAPAPGEEVVVVVAATPGEVLDAVRAWLDRFAQPGI